MLISYKTQSTSLFCLPRIWQTPSNNYKVCVHTQDKLADWKLAFLLFPQASWLSMQRCHLLFQWFHKLVWYTMDMPRCMFDDISTKVPMSMLHVVLWYVITKSIATLHCWCYINTNVTNIQIACCCVAISANMKRCFVLLLIYHQQCKVPIDLLLIHQQKCKVAVALLMIDQQSVN